jgi:hypothetical protein
VAKPRQVARGIETTAARFFEPASRIARPGRCRSRYTAAPVDMRATENGDVSLRHECSSAWPIGRISVGILQCRVAKRHAPDLLKVSCAGESAEPCRAGSKGLRQHSKTLVSFREQESNVSLKAIVFQCVVALLQIRNKTCTKTPAAASLPR